MGYTTQFAGRVTVNPPLNAAEVAFLREYADDDHRADTSVPSFFCQWVPTDDGTGIEWDQGEKFYEAEAWMTYLIDHFLKDGAHAQGQPRFEQFTFDHVLNGTIAAQGEEPGDQWDLFVTDNRVSRYDYPSDLPRYREDVGPQSRTEATT
jgi:hypothetical protein